MTNQTFNVHIRPTKLSGCIGVPCSKSAAHRAILCAALADGVSVLNNITLSEDVLTTVDAVRDLGAKVEIMGSMLVVKGITTPAKSAVLACHESGSTLRFLIPICAALGVNAVFLGEGRLPERPNTILLDLLSQNGIVYSAQTPPFSTKGVLTGGVFHIAANISSQYITGLLLALPLIPQDSEIVLDTPLESAGYVAMTLEMLAAFAVTVVPTEIGWKIPGGQRYKPCELTLEADYSGAAFWLCAGALGNELVCTGLAKNSTQGDRAILELLGQFGVSVEQTENTVQILSCPMKGIRIDASQIPDLVPILAVVAALSEGRTEIINASRLRIKESDRLAAVSECLKKLGADIEERNDGLIITGKKTLTGGVVSGYNDHRIVMSMAVAASRCTKPVTIEGAQAVAKSYPDFFEQYRAAGGDFDVV